MVLAHASTAPFLALTLMMLFRLNFGWVLQAMLIYSLAVICFLTGSWWGFAMDMAASDEKTPVTILWSSVIILLLAITAILALPPVWTVFALGALYILILWLQRLIPGLNRHPDDYRIATARLSMTAAGCHLLFGWGLSAI